MNFAEQLKNQLNIVDVVGQYVRLKRQGAGPRYVGLCPFHSEKTPSFGVHSILGYYKCFGCDAAGDVFKFVQEIESLTFPETLKLLAERYGIPMPERHRPDDPEAQRRDAIFEMHEIAADLFQKNLRGPMGADVRVYLESRNVSKSAIDEFRLGLSDASGQQLVEKLQRLGPTLMEDSGLISKRHDGTGYFDRFRARLMFPIHNESGKVIGFGARALRPNDEPKYLNSPETRIYKKSSVLYNLHRAKIDARKHDRMILVEGYMDVIGVYAAGIHEVVASSGTSLGIDQVRAIKRQVAQQQASTGQIILNFDPDPAGARSTEKYISVLLAEGLRVKVLSIPGGLDPDEYIQQNGVDAYRSLLDNAPSYFHWLADYTRENFDMRTAEGRRDAFKSMMPAISRVADRVERSMIAREISEYLNADFSAVQRELPAPEQQVTITPWNARVGLPANEQLLLTCLLVSEDARKAVRHYCHTKHVPRLLKSAILQTILALDEDRTPFSLQELLTRLPKSEGDLVTAISFSNRAVHEGNAVTIALQRLEAFEIKATEAECEALRRRIRESEQNGNLAEALRLTDELDRIRRAAPA